MKKYTIEYSIKDKDFIFQLASIGHIDLLNYPELLKIRTDRYNSSILHSLTMCMGQFNEEKQNKIISFLMEISAEKMEEYKDNAGDTPLHHLGFRGKLELMNHPAYNTILNNSYETPYCKLLERVPRGKLKNCLNHQDLFKTLYYNTYSGKMMPLDNLVKRSQKPTLTQLKKWGVPIPHDPKDGRKCINEDHIRAFKKNNALHFILS